MVDSSTGVREAAVGGSLCTLAVVGVWMWGLSQLRTLDRFAEASHAPKGRDVPARPGELQALAD